MFIAKWRGRCPRCRRGIATSVDVVVAIVLKPVSHPPADGYDASLPSDGHHGVDIKAAAFALVVRAWTMPPRRSPHNRPGTSWPGARSARSAFAFFLLDLDPVM